MIYMNINTHDYEHDVLVSIGAFYPGEKIITDADKKTQCRMSVCVTAEETIVTGKVNEDKAEEIFSFAPDTDDKKLIRNRLKRELYDIFSKLTGKILPWGTMTGIRPVKIPTHLMEQGYDDDYITAHLEKEYYISPRKAKLSLQVAHTEQKLLSEIDYENGCSLYVGIPFCPTTCLYCSFTSYPLSMWKNRVDEYLDALLKELAFLAEYLKGKKLNSVYIGGGTPTTLLPYQLDRLITFIEENFDLSIMKEFTVEAGRPDSIDRDKLMMLRKHNIGRISINPQTMNRKTLDLIGRRHTVEQINETFALARECGFDNINMDIIVGLPGENKADVENTLSQIGKLDPDSLTVHSLAIKRAARLNIMKEQYADYHIENTDEIINMTYDFAIGQGMMPYYLYRQKNMAGNFENVGYAKEGKAGVYNILIMEEKQSIYAAGANAQSKIVFRNPDRIERIENVKNVEEYIGRTDEMISRKINRLRF
ncbi:MAG: coproporphyrinogen dehydrogenase HemZ [Butyrivibrio sp.]